MKRNQSDEGCVYLGALPLGRPGAAAAAAATSAGWAGAVWGEGTRRGKAQLQGLHSGALQARGPGTAVD